MPHILMADDDPARLRAFRAMLHRECELAASTLQTYRDVLDDDDPLVAQQIARLAVAEDLLRQMEGEGLHDER